MSAADRAERGLQDLRSLLLGFDADPQDRKRVLSGYLAARAELGDRPLPGELDLLTVFADLSELSRNKPGGELDVEPDSPVHSPREYFHSYLQSLDVERAGVTEGFQAKLSQGPRSLRRRRVSTARRSWKPRSSGSSWPSSR